MHDGFELVKKKRKRKEKARCFTNFEPELSFNRKLNKAVEEFESSHFCFDILQNIDNCFKLFENNFLNEILSYGIGNFSESKSSLHQLAALLVFHKKYNSCVKLYDPVFSLDEIKFLEGLGFEVFPENEEGKRRISTNFLTLVFLPHCPKQLTNNFLWANWNINLRNCILIANSFTKITENNSKRVLSESANYIWKIQPKTTEIILENSYFIENIFNDISIHYFNCPSLTASFFIETLEKEPVYLQETELITKKIEALDLKNG